jgi:hypothetical protein
LAAKRKKTFGKTHNTGKTTWRRRRRGKKEKDDDGNKKEEGSNLEDVILFYIWISLIV